MLLGPALLPALPLAVAAAQMLAPTIYGTIRDSGTGEPLAGAAVEIAGRSRAAFTDSTGRYELSDIEAGTREVRIRRLGYRPRTLIVLVPPAGGFRLDVSLEPDPVEMRAIEVRALLGGAPADDELAARGGLAGVGMRSITAAEVASHPLLGESDVFAALGAAADLAVDPEAPSALHVHGGSRDQTLVLLDGAPVYAPYHAAGLFGAFNPDALDRVDLHTGVPSAAVGGALSGVLEAHTLVPEREFVGVRGAATVTSTRALLEGPLPGGAGFLVGARRGYATPLTPGDDDYPLDAGTSDLIAKVQGMAAGGVLEALAFLSENDMRFDARSPPGTNRLDWSAQTYSLRWLRPLGPSAAVTTQLWHARFATAIDWFDDDRRTKTAGRRADIGLETKVATTGERRRTLFGLRLERLETSYGTSTETELGESLGTFGTEATPVVLTAFAEQRGHVGDRLQGLAGLRVTVVAGGAPLLEPRLGVRWHLAPGVAVSAGYARTRQLVQSLSNTESPIDRIFAADLPVAAGVDGGPVGRSDEVSAALQLSPAPGTSLVVSGYVRRLGGLVLAAPVTVSPVAVGGFAVGEGRVSGVGVELARRGERLHLVTSYGLNRVSRTVGDATYVPAFAPTHSLSAALGYRIFERTRVRFAMVAHLGRRTTPAAAGFIWEQCNALEGGCQVAGSPRPAEGPLGAAPLPPYLRFDVGARHGWQFSFFGSRVATLGIFGTIGNVLDSRNIWTLAVAEGAGAGAATGLPMRAFSFVNVGIDWQY